MNVNNELL